MAWLDLLKQVSPYITFPILVLFGLCAGWLLFKLIKLKDQTIELKETHIRLLREQADCLRSVRKLQLEDFSNIDLGNLKRAQMEMEEIIDPSKKSTTGQVDLMDISLKYETLMKEIENKEKSISEFFSAAMQELRLPLQALIIAAGNLQEESAEENLDINFIRETVPKMLFQASKITQFVANIHEMIEMIQMPLEKREHEFKFLPIYQFIEQAIKRLAPEAKVKGVCIEEPLYGSGSLPELPLVEDKISIAFNNIYSNAIRYSYIVSKKNPAEGVITTRCSNMNVGNHKFFAVEVANFGFGITQEEIDSGRIFTPGYRGELSRDRVRAIPGVGLYIIRQVVEKIHKGKLEVNSNQEQGGYKTTVRVMLPYK